MQLLTRDLPKEQRRQRIGLLIPNFSFFVAMIVSTVAYVVLKKAWILKQYPQAEVAQEIAVPSSAPTVD